MISTNGLNVVFLAILVSILWSFTTEFKSFKTDIENQLRDITNQQAKLSNTVINGFNQIHDFGVDRVRILSKISMDLNYIEYGANKSSRASSHSISFNGIVAQVSVNHLLLGGAAPLDSISCNDVDVAFINIGYCPKSALDINFHVPLRMGDEVITYGFGAFANVARGHLSGYASPSKPQDWIPWNGTGIIHKNEYVFEGHEHSGMFGGATLNGCGYVGFSHIKHVLEDYYLVIPASEITKCLMENQIKLKSLDDCRNFTEILEPPRLSFC